MKCLVTGGAGFIGSHQYTMDIKTAILNRRSIRRFINTVPEKDLIVEILDIARWAPTHCNTQDVKFIIVDDDKIKQKIVDMGGSVVVKNSPIGILILYSNLSDNQEYSDYVQSAAAIIQTMLLYSYSKGLSTCWIAQLPKKSDLRAFFNIPTIYDPIAYILLGYSEKGTKHVPRKNHIEDLISYNTFDFNLKSDTLNKGNIQLKKLARGVYYNLPTIIKKKINPVVDKLFVKKFEN